MILDRLLNLFEAHRRLETELQTEQRQCSFWMAQSQRFEAKADSAKDELTQALKRIADEEHRALTGRHIFSEASEAPSPEGGRSIPAHHSTGRIQGRTAVRMANRAAEQRLQSIVNEPKTDGAQPRPTS